MGKGRYYGKIEFLNFRYRYDILIEKRLSGVADLRYTMVYGKSQLGIIDENQIAGDYFFKD
jgi:hypothetical protein